MTEKKEIRTADEAERKRISSRKASRRYYARLRLKIQAGDPAALAKQKKNNQSKAMAAARSYINNHATVDGLKELQSLINKKLAELEKQEN